MLQSGSEGRQQGFVFIKIKWLFHYYHHYMGYRLHNAYVLINGEEKTIKVGMKSLKNKYMNKEP